MKKLVKILFLFLALACLEVPVFAQQDAQVSHYMFNSIFYNPGYAGIEGNTRFTGIFRKQWLGYSSTTDAAGGTSPTTAILTASTLLPFFNKSVGAGMNFAYDSKGPLTTTTLNLVGSYIFKIKTGKLGVGLNGGIRSESVQTDWYNVINTNLNSVYNCTKNVLDGMLVAISRKLKFSPSFIMKKSFATSG